MHAIGRDSEFPQGRQRDDSVSAMRIGDIRSIEYPGDQFCDPEDGFPDSGHIVDFASFKESRTEIEIGFFVFQIQSKILVSMDMLHESFHIFDIHLSISIEADKPLDLEFIAVFLDKIISCLICGTSSPVYRMIKDDDKQVRILFLFRSKRLQGGVARSVIDKD